MSNVILQNNLFFCSHLGASDKDEEDSQVFLTFPQRLQANVLLHQCIFVLPTVVSSCCFGVPCMPMQ